MREQDLLGRRLSLLACARPHPKRAHVRLSRGTRCGGAGTSGEGANRHRFAAGSMSMARRGLAVVENTREPVLAEEEVRTPLSLV
jgi:hypothetical protein